jgi:7-carboxy-7-deazaguanine synthase
MKYPVNNIYPCIQGEGCQTGVPMVMVRLQGCEVGCPFCDTKETWAVSKDNERKTLAEALGQNERYCFAETTDIVGHIVKCCPGPKWALVSGGEPAQYDLGPLVSELHRHSYKAAVETSGTELGHIGADFDWVTISPKLNMPGGKKLKREALGAADEIKFPVGRSRDIDLLLEMIRDGLIPEKAEICLQPISQSTVATKLCIDTCLERGWRLSCQVHKYLGLP